MRDSYDTFAETINGDVFKDVPIIVFWNKKDMLEKKITEQDDLVKIFSDYKGGKSFDQAFEFIKKKFNAKISEEKKKICN